MELIRQSNYKVTKKINVIGKIDIKKLFIDRILLFINILNKLDYVS